MKAAVTRRPNIEISGCLAMSRPLRARNLVRHRAQTVIPRPAATVPAAPAILPAAVPVVRATAEGGPATKVADPDPAVTVPAEARVMIAAPVAPDLVKPPI